MKPFLIFILLFCSANIQAQEIQKVVSGKLIHIEKFPSQYVEARNIDIWLPENYDGTKKFAVLYMHDGQMLFDAATTWNKQSWNVDDVASKMLHENKLKDFIIVGIWNSGKNRYPDYLPQKAFESLRGSEKDTAIFQLKKHLKSDVDFIPNADNYLQFIVKELKPMIDKNYSVHMDKKNTFISGSSMGGLISLYAICEYPEVFGGAACISTHWIAPYVNANNPLPQEFLNYFTANLPDPKNHKLYFDSGDQDIDAPYIFWQEKFDLVLKQKGYSKKNWVSHHFKGKGHSEIYWNERLETPLLFLLGK